MSYFVAIVSDPRARSTGKQGAGYNVRTQKKYGERLMELQDDAWGGRLTDRQVIDKLRMKMLGEPS